MDIVAAADPAPAAAEGADIPVVASREALATIGALDFVDICTPTATHLDATLWALAQGYHVLCEKPVALTRDEAARITAAAHPAQRVVVPCHQYRFNPAWQQMLAWLREDAIGRWHLAELSVYRPAADAGSDTRAQPWRTVASESAGGILLDHGTHLLYSLLDAAGEQATGVRAWTGRLRHFDYGVEDTAQLTLEFPGRLATLMLTWSATHRENRVRFIGDRGSIDWQGGILRLERSGHAPESPRLHRPTRQAVVLRVVRGAVLGVRGLDGSRHRSRHARRHRPGRERTRGVVRGCELRLARRHHMRRRP